MLVWFIYLRQPNLLPLDTLPADPASGDAKLPCTIGRWLTALPSSPDTRLTCRQVRSAIALSYRLPIAPNLPTHCVCKLPITDAHFHCCVALRRTGVTTRHDSVLRLLVLLSQRAGITARAEPDA